MKPQTLSANSGIDWARRIVNASKTEAVPALKLAMAQEAIRNYEVSHPAIEREPGCDDEVADTTR
ncbi:hypothetical protein [Paraburkholderia dipogonis]|uniref:hypothetical protein n=1 Tax=Paraburkholderia dipogonis TaxID=1211383 RepID=UPI0038BA9AD9